MNAFTWIEAKTAEQAVAELSSERGGPALLKAGGVDVLDRLKEGLETPERLVNISRLGAGLREILVTEAKSVPPLVTKLLPSDKPGGEPTPRDPISGTPHEASASMWTLSCASQSAGHDKRFVRG